MPARPLALVVLVLCVIAGCANMFGFRRDTTHTPDGLASFALPDDWKPRDEVRTPAYALFQYAKSQRRWFGAGDPLEVHAWVAIMAPDADETTMQAAMRDALRRASIHVASFPEFGSATDGDRETWISAGTYRIHTLHDPEKVITVRSLDRARRVVFVARVYERALAHEQLQRVTREFFRTLAPSAGRRAFFAEVGDWPTVREARRRAERARVDAFLASRGLPPARLDSTVAHEGWVYTLFDDTFYIGRRLGSRRLNGMAYGARGELTWLTYGTRWDSHRASKAATPKRGTPYFPTDDALGRWAIEAGPELDRSLSWFYTVRRCPLTRDDWEPARDVAACQLDAWADNALAIERQFVAGTLSID